MCLELGLNLRKTRAGSGSFHSRHPTHLITTTKTKCKLVVLTQMHLSWNVYQERCIQQRGIVHFLQVKQNTEITEVRLQFLKEIKRLKIKIESLLHWSENLFLHLSKTSRHRWKEDLNQGHLKSSHFWQLSFAKWTPTQIQKQEMGYFQLLYYNSGQFHMFDLAESCTRCQIWNDSHTKSMKCYISVAE